MQIDDFDAVRVQILCQNCVGSSFAFFVVFLEKFEFVVDLGPRVFVEWELSAEFVEEGKIEFQRFGREEKQFVWVVGGSLGKAETKRFLFGEHPSDEL